jgi:hypothetical protein
VGIDHQRLREAGEASGQSRREVATLVSRAMLKAGAHHRLTSQTLDNLWTGRQRRCRASVRRALAAHFDVPESWLAGHRAWGGHGVEVRPSHRTGRLMAAWSELVASMGLSDAAHSALHDLPSGIARASLALGQVRMTNGFKVTIPSRLRAAVDAEWQAWHAWLAGWICDAGLPAVRRTIEARILGER